MKRNRGTERRRQYRQIKLLKTQSRSFHVLFQFLQPWRSLNLSDELPAAESVGCCHSHRSDIYGMDCLLDGRADSFAADSGAVDKRLAMVVMMVSVASASEFADLTSTRDHCSA